MENKKSFLIMKIKLIDSKNEKILLKEISPESNMFLHSPVHLLPKYEVSIRPSTYCLSFFHPVNS